MIGAVQGSPQLFYAFTLGMLAAVNPCGFPLLPAYLELFVGGTRHTRPLARVGRALVAGACSTLGFMLLFGALGIVVETGWSAMSDHAVAAARYVMVAVAVAMTVLGGATLLRRPVRLRLPELRPGLGLRRPLTLVVFGISYGIASIGCALPLFVSGVATAFIGANPLSGLAVFVAYALGMGAVLGTLAVATALVGHVAAAPLRRASRWIPSLGGLLLVLVGGYLTWYWLDAILTPAASFSAERVVDGVQQGIAAFVAGHAEIVGGVLGLVIVGGLVALGLGAPDRPRGGEPRTDPPDPDGIPEPLRSTP